MAPDMWLFSAILGLLSAALSGHPTPTPSGQPNTSSTETQPLESGEPLGIRLVNGSSHCSGTVEVWIRQSWEPACAAFWNHNATEAACRALSCGGAGAAVQPTLPPSELPPGPGAGNASEALNATLALAPAVLCRGPEWPLCDVVERPCDSDRRPAEVTCAENRAVRLVGGSGPCAGRVEMLERGQWGSVCDDTWDLKDAHVVCRQLNCGWAVQALPGLHFAPGQGPIHRDQVNCSGTEDHLWDCRGLPGNGYCGHKEDAGVLCSEHQSWRLTGGADSCEGQVEVHFRGVWSTVCDSEWYSSEAQVLCRTLGCGTVATRLQGLPHSLPGKMYYSCKGEEPTPSDCFWRFNNPYLCRQSRAARVLCSGSRSLLNLSTSEAPASVQPVTVEPTMIQKAEAWKSRELMLFILCIILGILLLGLLISTAFIFLKVKGKYALPIMVNDQHPPTTTPEGINSYQDVPITISKEEVPKLPIQVQALPPKDSDSSSDSDYEHYDFSAQPPVALTTFYNSQRHRVTEEEIQQSRFQMPPLEEGLEEASAPQVPPTSAGHYVADTPSLGSQRHPGSNRGSSTSSGEDYCNSPSSRLPLWTPQVFSTERSPFLEQPPNLELAGSQATFSGPSADDSSSTSSGEWYQNFQPPPQPPSTDQFQYPGASGRGGSPRPQPGSTGNEDYDDIGAS
ncbi:T-cell differentiation antigen CD6 isoform X1 [Prionailurus bengalensis]|uniref:T-cell differentiation antigen CD6 isoform X1 n=1 Tax=Prionailurus bengalensis TaxID=37029 RepID=UPI001CA930D2|nr:T-cell differentiation antigen CD6 isoform X1 [Prionailurus bengalensis]